MRGLKKEDSVIIKGLQIFHNFIREHEGLEGRTPAEASGIVVDGENKWVTIIQNTKRIQRPLIRLMKSMLILLALSFLDALLDLNGLSGDSRSDK